MPDYILKFKNFIFKHSLLISLLIIILSFLFSRLPFFIWAPIPEFLPDTFDYFYYIERLDKGILPSFDYLPQGFAFFVYLIGLISNKIIAVIYAQNILILLSSLFLINVIHKYYSWLSILCSIALSIYIMDSYVIRLDTGLITESLYTNTMIFLCAVFISAFNSNKKVSWLILSSALILPALIRSNGLYIYFLPFWMIIFMVINKFQRKYYFYLLIPFITLNLIWLIYNKSVDKSFHVPYSLRINKVAKHENYTQLIKVQDNKVKVNNDNYKQKKLHFFMEYLINIRYTKPQFYYTFINDRYRNLYIKKQSIDSTFRMFDGTKFLPDYLRRFTYREFYDVHNDRFKNNMYQFDVKNKESNYWLLLYHVYYKISSLIFWNLFWSISFIGIMLYSFYTLIKSKFENTNAFIIFSLCLIHFVSIIAITLTQGRLQSRYVSVTEFILYIIVALLPLLIYKNREIDELIKTD